ncbi:aminotransferase class III-fold pyridoxal phosphate-dependent enzyme [Nocardioides sp. CER19]|uniref:aminotransferase class III-fold pyridoxal phosphate-dependent enzyme n=1 Tax=Nocardioides sp. CER19 TaxID=3038538 RepID=UPI00244A93D0|nr:aminotransferase class III-fold pyridoxal phosphate-dependent enzyme [Nocardioides sp. CER19]MDH2415842.1 aminotransferase class III-fold pyridoxal phosphate-dependent enzyme [Nocardioides sp. CER19]
MTDLGGLARPVVDREEAAEIAARLWGLTGPVLELGSQQDRNFRIESSTGTVVLKVANAAAAPAEVDAQNAALATAADAGLRAPAVVPSLAGATVETVEVGGQRLLARVLTYVDGTPLLELDGFDLDHCRLLGATAGALTAALAGFSHPGTRRRTQWDLRVASDVLASLESHLPRSVSAELLAATDAAAARLRSVAAELPEQVIHGDLTDDNAVLDDTGSVGVIDFGDVMTSWRAAELAVTATSVLGKTADDVTAVLAVVGAFTEQAPLTDAELTAVWPLVVLRTGVLVASSAEQVALDGGNDYTEARQAEEVGAFQRAAALDAEELTWLVRASGQQLTPPPLPRLLDADLTPLDLSTTSPLLDDGAWLDPDVEGRLLRPGSVTRYGEYRLTRATPLARRNTSKVLALGVQVALPLGTRLAAAPPGVFVDGVDADGATVAPVVSIQVSALPGRPPAFVTPHAADVWRRLSPDPSPVLGVDVAAREPNPAGLLARRDAFFATVQEHYYDAPPQIERGWREHLVDTRAQVYVDAVNNVATTGHAHPALTAAAARQWSLLNTNSRFHYGAAVELAERLANLAPDGLDQVFLVNSGSEAVDLALRLATTATGRPRILAAREAYHGWTLASDAITTSLGDNPRALGTRPDWVELMDAPNAIRGTHRGPRAAAGYLADLDAQLAGLDTDRIAGVILEPIFGNGGGVLLPDGYLVGVFDRVRALGGVCISDEVQMGYGRLGHHFWGFEQQGAVPDIITVAKAMGNGQPLGAVITTRPIAEAFAAEGSFFSSAGGSPVSSAIGLAVLDVMASEHLQENATTVGDALKAGLEALGSTYDVIGAVHGLGLYLGVELVTDRESFTPATELTHRVCEALLDEGCIVQPTGDHKNVLKIKPPLVMTKASATFVTEALDRVLARMGCGRLS